MSNLKYITKLISPKGKIVYEYNPLYNYRKSSGELEDLITSSDSQLNFDLEHPVDIQCQLSYDGSVNLILNDNKNEPRLINTRFTVKENNTYERIDRTGNTDTNIYDESEFEIDASLLKKYVNIPNVKFTGLYNGGNLPVGNYVFYFKLADADGNETDIVAESGLVSVHIGSLLLPSGIRGGQLNENSGKFVQFILSNIDSGYDYVHVYYSRTSSADNLQRNTEAIKIINRFRIQSNTCLINITGSEQKESIPVTSLSLDFFLPATSKTATVCLNMLMMGNVSKYTPSYETLSKLSLGFVPYYKVESEESALGAKLNEEYASGGYYFARNIYEKVGYWNEEIYRFGVVYIMSNGSLSPVYNIRGINNVPKYGNDFEYIKYDKINIDYDTQFINTSTLENSAGVCRINDTYISENENENDYFKVRNFIFVPQKGLLGELQKESIKGYFFVRLKRVPTILCLAFMIGHDTYSGIPAWKIKNSEDLNNKDLWITESFISSDGRITHEYNQRLVPIQSSKVKPRVGLCPEYIVNLAYFNNIFTGSNITCKQVTKEFELLMKSHHVYSKEYKSINSTYPIDTKIISVLDLGLTRDGDALFRNVAGEANSLKYQSLSTKKHKPTKENFTKKYQAKLVGGHVGINKDYIEKCNLRMVRGLYGPYLGIYNNNSIKENTLVNIYIPGFDETKFYEYFRIRINNNDPYFAVTDRKNIDTLSQEQQIYRGDCFISQFTHRLNRNFLDPDAPTNDEIIDENTWINNYDEDKGSASEINRSDLNAVKLGTYFTIKCYTTFNLAMRDEDNGYPSEEALTGCKRSFYPYSPLRVDGNSKIPDSTLFNQGFASTTSERMNFLQPPVPYIKNIFLTRVIYSDIAQNDAFKNGFRVFKGISSVDYPIQYGGITKLVEWKGNIIIIFEHGIGLAQVNQNALIPTDDGTQIAVGAIKPLSDTLQMISTDFGSQWSESICKTDIYIYGVDTIAKKIWRTNGSSIECISDLKVLKFLNDNITLGERELTPIIGVRNVKTHYNANKHDVMFTYYDNLLGFEEKAWNLCYNELQQLFITFYSWIPSYSANIDNSMFTYDRNSSKWIAKLAISKFGKGIVVDKNIIENKDYLALLSLNRDYIPGNITFELVRGNFGDEKFFNINENGLLIITKYDDLRFHILNRNPIIPVIQLNIKCNITSKLDDTSRRYVTTNLGQYQNQIFLTFKDIYENISSHNQNVNTEIKNITFETDFWKHGYAGIIDISEPIKPCYWYHKQHPFEFEYITGNDNAGYKQFTNLTISSNHVLPESIHYTIVGDSYDFSDNKKNLYWRQEATKAFYQYNGSDILYDRKVFENPYKYYPDLITSSDYNEGEHLRHSSAISSTYKDTIFTLIYSRQDSFNEIEDFYKKINPSINSDYPNITGCEIYWDAQMNQFSLCNHVKIRDIKDVGRTRGNAQYVNDKIQIQITPINVINKNFTWWKNDDGIDLPKLIINNIPYDIYKESISDKDFPEELLNLKYDTSKLDNNLNLSKRSEIKLMDKYLKTKIRYKGDKLTTVLATATTFNTFA